MKLDTPHRSMALAPLLFSTLLLAACGGGGGGTDSTVDATAATTMAEADTVAADPSGADAAAAAGDDTAAVAPTDDLAADPAVVDDNTVITDPTASDEPTLAEETPPADIRPVDESDDPAAEGVAEGDALEHELPDTEGVLGYDGEEILTATEAGRETAQAVRSGKRNILKQPFAQRSIWNMPIGNGARYVPARLSSRPRNFALAPMPAAERDHIVLRPTAPMTTIYRSDAGWSGRSRCSRSNSKVLARVPIPHGYTVKSARTNDSAAFLMSDRRTVIESQPLARCSAGGIATGWTTFPKTDLYGDGIAGSHGGSGMSALGGTLRVGEMRPGSQGPQHALKMVVDAATMLSTCQTRKACFRWPARNADTYAARHYGRKGTKAPSGLKMGALLALPRTLRIGSLGLESAPGRQLAWTLQNYGAYIVDDTYGAGLSFAVEVGPDGRFEDQFRRDFGQKFEARSNDNTAWARDVRRIVTALHLVDNNSQSRVGGGGSPLQPLAAGL